MTLSKKLSFHEHKKNFEKYATLRLPDGRLVMSTQDFVTSLLPPGLESRKLTKVRKKKQFWVFFFFFLKKDKRETENRRTKKEPKKIE